MGLDQFKVIRQSRERGAINIVADPYFPRYDNEPEIRVPARYDAHACVLFYPTGEIVRFVAFGVANALALADDLFGPVEYQFSRENVWLLV